MKGGCLLSGAWSLAFPLLEQRVRFSVLFRLWSWAWAGWLSVLKCEDENMDGLDSILSLNEHMDCFRFEMLDLGVLGSGVSM
jgi:hypothetical protein